jgi:peptidoglycan hydrolase-like protein with peptidoglycan-binding domain
MSGAHTRPSRTRVVLRGRSGWIGLGVGLVVLAVAVAGGVVYTVGLAGPTSAYPALSHRRQAAPDSALQLVGILPETGTGPITGTEPVVVELSEPLAPRSPLPQMSVAGTWQPSGDSLVFQPSVGLIPSSTLHLTVPGGPGGLKGQDGTHLASSVSASWQVAPGSILRVDQLLATLGYLPVTWTPAEPTSLGPANQAAAIFTPPDGSFAWRYPNTPAELQALWAPGQDNVLLQGAIMAFEAHEGLPTDGVLGPEAWAKLIQVTESPAAEAQAENPDGYTYTFVSKALPEAMTVWHDGAVVVQTAVNTGIPIDPTADGTFPVYERLQTQIMQGTNPDGSHYADPVAWVAYFNGGDAVHYIARSAFGYPQSLGCVEAPYGAAEQAWPYLSLGSLVTVSG